MNSRAFRISVPMLITSMLCGLALSASSSAAQPASASPPTSSGTAAASAGSAAVHIGGTAAPAVDASAFVCAAGAASAGGMTASRPAASPSPAAISSSEATAGGCEFPEMFPIAWEPFTQNEAKKISDLLKKLADDEFEVRSAAFAALNAEIFAWFSPAPSALSYSKLATFYLAVLWTRCACPHGASDILEILNSVFRLQQSIALVPVLHTIGDPNVVTVECYRAFLMTRAKFSPVPVPSPSFAELMTIYSSATAFAEGLVPQGCALAALTIAPSWKVTGLEFDDEGALIETISRTADCNMSVICP